MFWDTLVQGPLWFQKFLKDPLKCQAHIAVHLIDIFVFFFFTIYASSNFS